MPGHSMRLLGALAVCAALTGCAAPPAPPGEQAHEALQSTPFRFKDGGQALYYTLSFGRPSANSALIFFVSGSGCASVRSRLPGYFAPLRDMDARLFALQKRGIAEDTAAHDCPDTFARSDYFDQTLADQREFIAHQPVSCHA